MLSKWNLPCSLAFLGFSFLHWGQKKTKRTSLSYLMGHLSSQTKPLKPTGQRMSLQHPSQPVEVRTASALPARAGLAQAGSAVTCWDHQMVQPWLAQTWHPPQPQPLLCTPSAHPRLCLTSLEGHCLIKSKGCSINRPLAANSKQPCNLLHDQPSGWKLPETELLEAFVLCSSMLEWAAWAPRAATSSLADDRLH